MKQNNDCIAVQNITQKIEGIIDMIEFCLGRFIFSSQRGIVKDKAHRINFNLRQMLEFNILSENYFLYVNWIRHLLRK